MRAKVLLVGMLGALAMPAQAGDAWPQFRGPTGDGHSDAMGLPLTWSETQHVRWKTAIPGEGWSSPVALGRQIWMTTATEKGSSLRAICVDKETGQIIHDIEVFRVEDPGPKNPLNSYASPTPVIEPGRVYISFGNNGNACLATDTGAVLWKNTELRLDHIMGAGSSPILYRDLYILNCDGGDVRYVAALNKQTGKLVWKTNRSDPIDRVPDLRKAYSVPQIININGRDQMVSVGAFRVNAYEPLTGKELWWCDIAGWSNVPRPIFGHGLIFVGTGYSKAELWAIRPGGTGDLSRTGVVWKVAKNASEKPSLVLVGDELYMISDQGMLTCLDAKTGRVIWHEIIGGQYSASPVYADGRIYFSNHNGKTTVIKPGRTLEIIATNHLDAGCMASPAIVGKAIYLRTKTHLYRLEKQ